MERVACQCWWQSPNCCGNIWSQDRLIGLFVGSAVNAVDTKGVWPLTVGEIVCPLPFLWGLWVTAVLPLLVFSLHAISGCQRRTCCLKSRPAIAGSHQAYSETLLVTKRSRCCCKAWENPLPEVTDWSVSNSLTLPRLPLGPVLRGRRCLMKQARQESQPVGCRACSKCRQNPNVVLNNFSPLCSTHDWDMTGGVTEGTFPAEPWDAVGKSPWQIDSSH